MHVGRQRTMRGSPLRTWFLELTRCGHPTSTKFFGYCVTRSDPCTFCCSSSQRELPCDFGWLYQASNIELPQRDCSCRTKNDQLDEHAPACPSCHLLAPRFNQALIWAWAGSFLRRLNIQSNIGTKHRALQREGVFTARCSCVGRLVHERTPNGAGAIKSKITSKPWGVAESNGRVYPASQVTRYSVAPHSRPLVVNYGIPVSVRSSKTPEFRFRFLPNFRNSGQWRPLWTRKI